MVRIHVGLDLEHERRHLRFLGIDRALVGLLRARQRRDRADRVEQIADAEVLQRRAEEHRTEVAFAKRRRSNCLQASRTRSNSPEISPALRLGLSAATSAMLMVRSVPALPASPSTRRTPPPSIAMVPTKSRPRADRPVDRGGVERQRLLDFVEQFERIAALAVHLVDEGEDRDVAQPADLEQLAGARLDALGGVDHHHRAVDRGQRAVGVLGEVLVARCVQQVEDAAVIFERHHRRDDRDAALAFDRHPVGLGGAAVALGLDVAGELDGAAEQQELFRQRGLARIRMRDDGKGPAALDLGRQRRAVMAGAGNLNVHAGYLQGWGGIQAG